MLPTEELFVYVYVLIYDLRLGGAIVVPDRPRTRASAAGPSKRSWPPAAPPSSSRPISASAPPCPAILLKIIAEWRNRIETTFSEITDRMELARHGAHTFWGLLTRTAATIAAHTMLRVCLSHE